MNDKTTKAVNFDLDTKALKIYYPRKHYRQAYRDIRKFMLDNGFTHRQWSGYNSKDKLSNSDVQRFVTKLSRTFPWLGKCVNRFDVTDIGEQHDLTYILTGKCTRKVKEVQKEDFKPRENKSFFSVKQLKERANQISKQPHIQNTKNISKDMER